jgi:hypothetical protein
MARRGLLEKRNPDARALSHEAIMVRFRLAVTVLALALLGASAYQEKDKDKEKKGDDTTPTKVKGTLPANFGKLGLSDEQKQKIYRLRAEYKGKIRDLEQKLARLRAEQKEAEEAVLTKDQKKKLRELRTGEKGSEKKSDK